VDRRHFLQAAAIGGTPAIVGAGLGGVAHHVAEDDNGGKATAAGSAPGLGVHRIVWSGPTDTDAIALTFDDGPDAELTPKVLDILDRFDVRATFMVVGERVAARPDLVRRAVDAGHEIGNHTWSHRSLATLSPDEVRAELGRNHDLLARVVPTAEVAFFRPPRGILTGAAAQAAGEHGYDVLLWSCTRGASNADAAGVSAHLTRHLVPGTVACLHDGTGRSELSRWPWQHGLRAKRRVEISALAEVIRRVRDADVRFVTASALVR
jgi:peptidoglycan/xylan/chitin deacetylase (PgdA/CDA1 family)